MSKRGEVLVAILNNQRDFAIARDQLWYRIPVTSVNKWLKECWPPRWLAFYMTKEFKQKAHAVSYYSRVVDIRWKSRCQLFPDLPHDEMSDKRYHQLFIEPLNKLPKPIYSRRGRRLAFIPTTCEKFIHPAEINDLYDESPLEDRLWAELKRLKISAERQEFVQIKKRAYALDFAIYCAKGKLDIETDGDFWHHNPEKAPEDNVRNNDLASDGWKVLRFNTSQIHDQLAEYCIPKIADTINNLGGVEEAEDFVRKIDLKEPGGTFQMGLFDLDEESR
jgi:very-short-patch-repair endonuclease